MEAEVPGNNLKAYLPTAAPAGPHKFIHPQGLQSIDYFSTFRVCVNGKSREL
jgi:hypothetical protein